MTTVMSRSSLEEMENQLRQQFEAVYKDKIKTMHSMFELRYQSLEDSIISVFDRIKKDELLATMLNDRTSSLHMEDRLKEIFGEVVAEERELIFKKLGTQIANLKFENQEMTRQLRRLKQSNNSLEKEFSTEKLTFEQVKHNVNEELKKTKEENFSIMIDRKSKEQEGLTLRHRVDEVAEENYELKTLLSSLKENMEIYKNKAEQTQQLVDSLTSTLKANQEVFSRKYKNKKKEIEQYKAAIGELKNQSQVGEKHNRDGQHQQERMVKMVRDHDQKVSEIRHSNQREKIVLERKYDQKLKETQNYFERMLQSKMMEIEENTANFYDKVRGEGLDLENRIHLYEENYISLSEFQEEIGKREQLMLLMKRKLEEFEGTQQMFTNNEEGLLAKLRSVQSTASEYKQKAYHLEEMNTQITLKFKSFEQSNSIFQINEKKVDGQFEQYERIVRKTKEENEDLKSKCLQLEDAKSQFENTLRQKQRKHKQNNDEIDELTKRSKKNIQMIENLTKEKDNLLEGINEFKKTIVSLEYSIKDQQLASSLTSGSLENKSNSLQQQLKDRNNFMDELQSKYQEISNLYQDEKKKNYEIENLLKKYEMESKFFKESGEMHKADHQLVLEEIRKISAEKNRIISQLETECSLKAQQFKSLEKEKDLCQDRFLSESKHLRNKVKMLSKTIIEKLQGFRKEGKLIKDYLKGREAIIKNDEAIFISNFNREIVYYQNYIEKQRDVEARRLKEELLSSQNNQMKLLKNSTEEKSRTSTEKHDYEKSLLRQEIKEKDERAEELGRQIKKGQMEVRKEREEARNIEREIQLATTRSEQLKQHYEQKLRELVKQMKDEKESLVRENSDKRVEFEQEISQLINAVKQLKTETQLIITKHEEEKLTINAHLRTVREQEEAVQKIVHQKDLEMQKNQKNYETAEEARRGMENQVRGYSDTLNRKIQLIHELELKANQMSGESNLIKNRCERMTEQNSELKRKLAQREEDYEQSIKTKARSEAELRDIKGALNRSHKNHELRSLGQLSNQTMQLSQKVNEMRRFNTLLDSKTPLRS